MAYARLFILSEEYKAFTYAISGDYESDLDDLGFSLC